MVIWGLLIPLIGTAGGAACFLSKEGSESRCHAVGVRGGTVPGNVPQGTIQHWRRALRRGFSLMMTLDVALGEGACN